MGIPLFALNVAGSEWFILIIAIIIILSPTKITGITKSIGKLVGEYEKTKNNLLKEKNSLFWANEQQQPYLSQQKYAGPKVLGPVSSEREKLEKIAKSLSIQIEGKSDDELRDLISFKLKETQG